MESLVLIISVFPLWIILLCLIFVLWFVFKKVQFLVWKIPPGPIGIPFFGHVFISKPIYNDIAQINKTYGKICSLNILSCKMIVVSDYDTAKELLCHPSTLCRPEGLFDFVPGNAGFATMEGKEWITDRRCCLQALKTVGLGKELWDVIILEEVVKTLGYIAATRGQPIDLHQQLSSSAICNMLALVMGRDFLNALSEEKLTLIYEGVQAFKEQFENAIIGAVFPRLRNYLVKFNVGRYGWRDKAMKIAGEILRKDIIERLNSEEGDDKTDFIKQYTKQKRKNLRTGDISVECLLGNILVFLSTSDTAMAATQWLLYIMASYSKIQANVHDEIDRSFGRNVTITWEDRKKLPYTMACIYEMERWVAIVPAFVPRRAAETFEFHGFSIPKGYMIVASGRALNRDPKYWNRPDEYIPDRFLLINTEKISTLEGYAPFSFGKRSCPGERIAFMTVYLYFTGIMQRFQVKTPSGDPPDLTPQFNAILEPKRQDLCFIQRQ